MRSYSTRWGTRNCGEEVKLQNMFNTLDPDVIYALDPAQLRINDVVLTSQHGVVSAMIRMMTRSNFSHAAIVTRNNSLIEAVMRGVVRRSLVGVWTSRREWICVLRPPSGIKLYSAAYRPMSSVVEDGFANPYSLLGAAGIKFTWLKALRGQGYFCSELVAAAFAECGYPVALTAPHTVSPELLRSTGRLNDVTASCVRILKRSQFEWDLVLDVSKTDHSAGEARVLRLTFRELKAKLSLRLLPAELQSTPAIIGWLMCLDRRQLGVATADDTVSRVLEYGGYVRWFTERSAQDVLGAATTFGALLAVPETLQGSRQFWSQLLHSAMAKQSELAFHAQYFHSKCTQNGMRTAYVLRNMYRSMEQDAHKYVQVLQRLIATTT